MFAFPALHLLLLHLAVMSLALTPLVLSNGRKAEIITHCIVPNTVALTFDDGPYQYIYEITKQLAAANASATFFLNGDNYGCIYSEDNVARVQHVFDSGHQVASHTWSHRDLTTLSRGSINDEMRRIDQALLRITGALPAFFRPPYGNYNNLVREVAASRKQAAVLWDFDSGDSVGASSRSQKSRYTQLVQRRPNSVLTLNHEVYSSTVHDVLPKAISQLQEAGYNLVTVAECLGRQPYQSLKAPSQRDSSWHC